MKYLLLLLSLLLVSNVLYSQKSIDNQINKIRNHYYGFNSDLKKFDKVILSGSKVVAYFNNGVPEKIVVRFNNVHTQEIYTNQNGELLFIYEKSNLVENRYYYDNDTVFTSLIEELIYPRSIRILTKDGELDLVEEPEFLIEGLDKASLAIELFSHLSKVSKDLKIDGVIEKVINIRIEIEEAKFDSRKSEENTSTPNEDGNFSFEYVTKSKSNNQIIKKFFRNGIDTGHSFISSNTKGYFYSRNNELVIETNSNDLEYFGSYDSTILDRTSGLTSNVVRIFYENGNMIYEDKVFTYNGRILKCL
ncbi:hypothetical protein [Flammeovirga pacifica]|nr:hypothetical protein [Flammeovirga pacifica]